MLNDFGIEENQWAPEAGINYDWSNSASFATGPEPVPAVSTAAVHVAVMDPTIDYSVYVPADPLPAYVPPAFTPVIDYTQPEPIHWEPTPTYTPPVLIQPPAPDMSLPTPVGGSAAYDYAGSPYAYASSPENWTPAGNDQPLSFAGFETVYDNNGNDTGSFVFTGIRDPGEAPVGPAAQAAYDTSAAVGGLIGAGATAITGIGALFGYGLPIGVGVGVGSAALSDNIRQGAQDWQYQGALEGSLGGINGTNQNLDQYDMPPSNADPFNRLTPTFQWNGSDNNWFTNDNLNAGYSFPDYSPVASYTTPAAYSSPVYNMPDYLGTNSSGQSWGSTNTPALTGGGGMDYMFGNDGFGFDTFNFSV